MRVLFAPHGTRGDVQPLVALAIGLRARGHLVSFLVPDNFVRWIRTFGFPAEPNGIDVAAYLTSPSADLSSRRWQLDHVKTVMIPRQFDAFARLTANVDVIVGAGVQIAAVSAAEKYGVPYVNAGFCPCVVPSSAWPPPPVHTQTLPPPLNRMLWTLGAPVAGLALRGAVNEGRRHLGLRPVLNPLSAIARATTIIAADRDLAPIADDVPDPVIATDAWFLRDRTELDASVEQFLEAGSAPIYAGFGSMVAKHARELAGHLVFAARALGRRLLLAGGWARLDRHVLDDGDVLTVDAVPHDAVFRRALVIVHHGGAGTTTVAARAGIPQVILPHVLDQYYWAHRVAQLGLGPRGLPVDLVNADVLTARIEAALDADICDRAAAFAPVIAARDGVPDAIAVLENVVAG